MKYYIDFDNTLYETAKLTTCMLKAITDTVVENLGKDHDEVETYVKEHFNSTTDNIFTYARETGKYYGIEGNFGKMRPHSAGSDCYLERH